MVSSFPRRVKTKTIKLVSASYFSAKHVAIRRKNKDLLAQNQDNVSEWSDISTD
jgi:hypothetical protein